MSQSHVYLTADKYLAREHGPKMAINDFETNKSNIKTYFSITNSTSGGFKHFDASQ